MAEAEAAIEEEQPEAEAPAPAKAGRKFGLALILPLLLTTFMAVGTGAGLGLMLFSEANKAAESKAKAAAETKTTHAEVKYPGNLVIQTLDPVVTNLASPTGVWIRLELAMVFPNGALPNPQVAAAEIRQDVLAYARTMALSQLESPSALQHLREDLNERATLRTGGRVRELIVQSMVVQ